MSAESDSKLRAGNPLGIPLFFLTKLFVEYGKYLAYKRAQTKVFGAIMVSG